MADLRPSTVRAVGADLAHSMPNDGLPWYKRLHLVKLNFCIVSLVLLSAANGYDGSLMNGLQALEQWQVFMDHPTGAWLGFINAIQSLSTFVVLPLVAWVSDNYGRKVSLYIGYLFLFLGTSIGAAAHNPASFIVSRFFMGQPSAWFAAAAPLLMTEIAWPTHRGTATALYFCGWYVGSILSAWITFASRNIISAWAWRLPTLCQAAVPVVGLIGVIMVPESPRYLFSVGKSVEAESILIAYHGGGTRTALVEYEIMSIMYALKEEMDTRESSGWMDMIRTKGNRRRTLISITLGIFAQWCGNGVVSYYLSLVLDTVGITSVTHQTLINACLQIWNLVMAVGAAFNVDRLGRRFLFLASAGGMLVSYTCITGLSGSFAETGNAAAGIAVIPILFLFFGAYDIAFTPLLVSYPAEIWPYTHRARGVALTTISAYIGIFFNVFVNPIALDAIGWRYYIFFAVFLVIILVTIFFVYPETRGRSLEEIAVIFDGDSTTGRSEKEVVGQ